MIESVRGAISRIGALGLQPEDAPDERLRKSTLTLTAALILAIAPAYVAIYWLLGRPLSAAIPGAYWVVSLLSVVHFARTRRYRLFRASQVAMMLLLPFLLQWSLGGFVAGSGVMVWAFVAPMGTLLWYGVPEAWRVFGAYLALTAVSGLIDARLAAAVPPLPTDIRLLFFVMTIAGVSLTTYVVLAYFVRQREAALAALDRANAELTVEREKSEHVLRNVLPDAIAARLKEGATVIADEHDAVTVVFADIAGFTPLAARMPAADVVGLLDRVFTTLDGLAEEHGLEKIKTVGDAYMAVAGAPTPRPDHAEAAAEMALAMAGAVDASRLPSDPPIPLRIGIHTGRVTAGVIGRRKFAYDLWGDAVNLASRMESHGIPGRIQVTEETHRRLCDRYAFEARGPVAIKGVGEMRTYLLVGRLAGGSVGSGAVASGEGG